MRKALERSKEVINPTGRRVWFIRHPIQRLHSCFRYLHTADATTLRKGGLVKEDYEPFIDRVLTEPNRHYSPQSEMVEATEIYRFEDINEIWPKLVDVPLPHINQSNYKAVSPYRQDELDNLYKEDLEIWQRALTADTKTQ